ncbi:MAG: rod-binding protein [Alphaproteobacteria bacterium]
MTPPDAALAQTLFVNSANAPRFGQVRTADEARRVAGEFEAFFLSQVLDNMTASLPTDGPFGGGHAEGIYRSMTNQEYGKLFSRSGGYGIADAVYRQILRLQEIEP